jgi:hypothetical protein
VSASTALAAAATLVALAMGLCTWERWIARRRRHDLAWAVALALFTMAAGALWLGSAAGWTAARFRVFYLLGAIVNVPVLALGTLYLLGDERRGDRCARLVAGGAAFATGVLVSAPLRAPVPADRLPRGAEVFGALPVILAAVASSIGAAVVIGGAALSAVRAARRGGPRRGRAVAANLLIVGGTLVLSGAGLLNSVLGAMGAFAVTLAVGVSLLFGGFLTATAGGKVRSDDQHELHDGSQHDGQEGDGEHDGRGPSQAVTSNGTPALTPPATRSRRRRPPARAPAPPIASTPPGP